MINLGRRERESVDAGVFERELNHRLYRITQWPLRFFRLRVQTPINRVKMYAVKYDKKKNK